MLITKRALLILALLSFASLTNASILTALWGVPAPNSFYVGMWSVHFDREGEKNDNNHNDLIGIVCHSIFFGTLRNSFSDRMFAGGVQRNVYVKDFGHGFTYYLGYRAGLVSGYDGRMMHIAEHLPVLPFAQLLTSIRYRHFAAELSYTGVVLSGELYFAF